MTPNPAPAAVPRLSDQPVIWAVHCPFRKNGTPVLGTMGAEIRGVIVIPVETWTALCREIPALGAKQFTVGS